MLVFKFSLVFLLLNQDLVNSYYGGFLVNKMVQLERTQSCLKKKLDAKLRQVTASLVKMCEAIRSECNCNGKSIYIDSYNPEPWGFYPNNLYPNNLYPNNLYPNNLYPNNLYPSNLYPNIPRYTEGYNIMDSWPSYPSNTVPPENPFYIESYGNETNFNPEPESCRQARERDRAPSGLILIRPIGSPSGLYVECEMNRLEGGWAIFLNRIDNIQSFAQSYEKYKYGFGDFRSSYWLGLEPLYYLTRMGSELLVVLQEWDGRESFALYQSFRVGSEQEGYAILELSGYSGTAENTLEKSLGRKFSTFDRDFSKGCSAAYGGRGWWFTECQQAHFTRKNDEAEGDHTDVAMRWLNSDGPYKFAIMMVRSAK